jgi:hypothetical protein
LLASAKGSYDTRDTELRQLFASLSLLDRQLVHYGPEAKEARDLLRRYTTLKIDAIWPDEASQSVKDGTLPKMPREVAKTEASGR